MSYQAFVNSLPPPYEPNPGERVELLHFHNSAVKGVTHEVRLVPRPDQISGRGIFFGSKKACLSYIETRELKILDRDAELGAALANKLAETHRPKK